MKINAFRPNLCELSHSEQMHAKAIHFGQNTNNNPFESKALKSMRFRG